MSCRARASLPTSQRLVFALFALCLAAVLAVQTLQPRAAEAATTAEGILEVVHEDNFAAGRSQHQYFLRGRGGEVTQLLFDDAGPEGLGGRRVRVAGTPAGAGRMHVGTTAAVTELDATTSTTTGNNLASATTNKKIAVILFKFSDTVEEPMTPAEADSVIFGSPNAGVTTATSSNDYYFENAFGTWSLAGAPGPTATHIFGWVRIPNASTESCNYTAWGQTARNMAAADLNFVDANYDHVVHIMPKSTCTFGGVAYMPGKYSWTVATAFGQRTVADSVRLVNSHELGHNFGVHHSGSYRCTAEGVAVVLSSTCTLAAYGDPYSVMGNAGERHMTNYQKGQLGWFGSGRTHTVSSGREIIQLQPVETSSAGIQSLRIPTASGRNKPLYYVEYRKTHGFDTFDTADTADDGVLIRIAPDYGSNAVSKLLDATPGTETFSDAAFVKGTSFHDANRGVTITVLDVVVGSHAMVEVAYSGSTSGSKGNGKK